jgi:DNA end-binding protein Ku
MAPRTTWKGFLTLARVSCAVRLHPAVLRIERLGLQALNRTTLNRVQMRPYDPQTGKELSRAALVRGYEIEAGRFVLVEDRELAELQIESSRNIVLDRFVERSAIDTAYLDTPYFLMPDAPGAEAPYAVIREAMAREQRLGLGRIVLGSRERAALVAPRGRGMLLTTLRAAHEVRSDESYFSDIPTAAPDEEMVGLAARIVGRRAGTFDPKGDFRDRYQEGLFQLVQAKLKGEKPVLAKPAAPTQVIDLREALEASVTADDEPKPAAASRRNSGAVERPGRPAKKR